MPLENVNYQNRGSRSRIDTPRLSAQVSSWNQNQTQHLTWKDAKTVPEPEGL